MYDRLILVVLLATACSQKEIALHSFLTGERIPSYTARRTREPIEIDGRLDETAWAQATSTSRYVDMMSGERVRYDTHGLILWDERYLYVGIRLQEPNVAGTFTRRDAPLYQENNAEFFLAGENAYYELEINALGTIYEAFFVWKEAYDGDGYSEDPQLALDVPRHTGFNGVGYRDHPRGPRHAFLGYDFPGLRSAVWVEGTPNDDTDEDVGWSVELALPWESMESLARGDGRSLPPEPGDVWRMNLFRFNSEKAPKEAGVEPDSGAWAWARHSVYDSHVPEVFSAVTFVE